MKACLATLCALLCVGAASANITVTGTGKVSYTPDLATLILGVSSEGKTAAEAWEKNRQLVARLFEVLKKHGIDPKDMKTSNLSVTPRYQEKPTKERILIGYLASYDLTITVRKLDDLGPILDEMVASGANRNVSLTFGCSDLDSLMGQARARAVAEVRKKAETFVTGAGARLGQVLSINDGSYAPPYYPTLRFEHAAKAGEPSSLPIAAGEQELSVNVTVSYEIDNSMAP